MDGFEVLIFIGCLICTGWFFWYWYTRISMVWPEERSALAKRAFTLLPAAAAVVILITLTTMASFDVVGSLTFIIFYMLMGCAFIFAGMIGVGYFFDILWDYDALHNANKAAVPAVAGAFLGLTVIYSGANIGDGPGWWTVVVAGGLGYAAWFALMRGFNKFTGMFEGVTVERDLPCGIRLGCYFIAAGIILGRASAGDWTSFTMTVIEFFDGWQALPFLALLIVVERNIFKPETVTGASGRVYTSLKTVRTEEERLRYSIIAGGGAILAAALIVALAIGPLPKTGLYGDAASSGYYADWIDIDGRRYRVNDQILRNGQLYTVAGIKIIDGRRSAVLEPVADWIDIDGRRYWINERIFHNGQWYRIAEINIRDGRRSAVLKPDTAALDDMIKKAIENNFGAGDSTFPKGGFGGF